MPKGFGSDHNHVDRTEKLVCRIGQARFQASFSITANFASCTVLISVADPWHFASDSWIRIRILLFSSLTFKTPIKKLFSPKFFCLLLFEGKFTSKKVIKKSQNSRNQGFPYYFCVMMIEGSGSEPLTNGSGTGSRRPKTTQILQIRNTGAHILGSEILL